MKIKYISLVIIVLTLSSTALAQQKITLKELVKLAIEQNYQIKILKNEELKLQNSNLLGNSGFYPVLTLDGSRSHTNSSTKQTLYNGEVRESNAAISDLTNASLNLNWDFFDGFKMFASKDKLDLLEKLGKLNTRYYIEQTVLDIASAYFQLIYEINLQKLLEQTIINSRITRDLIQTKVKIGNSSNFELQKADYDINLDSIAILNEKQKIQNLKIEINKILNRDPYFNFEPLDLLEINDSIVLDRIKQNCMKNNLSLNMEQIKKMSSEKDFEIQKSNLYPTFTAYSSYSYQNQDNTVSIYRSNNSQGLSYGLRFNFNLFNGTRDVIAIQNTKIDIENSEFIIKEKENELISQLYGIYGNYSNNIDILILLKQNSSIAFDNLELAQKQFELGMMTLLDLRDIQLNYLQSNISLLQTEYLTKLNEIELYRLEGTLLIKILE
ncbi:MAG: hypothetical protein A2X64_07085 [Ignavibacteria bacterium GWF2_33_9]|nr:MAG: hypothetical protein A2X64_07085 [Ignavibacteria bacterium GWF2_33_9]